MTEEPKDIYGVESTQPHAGERGANDHPPAPTSPTASPSPSPSPRTGRPIDPASSSDAHEPSAHEPPAREPPAPRRPDPLPLEDSDSDMDETPPALRSVKALDVCPNCGANMAGASDVVCLRCGFDLKTMKQVATATGVVEVSEPGVLADDDQQQRVQRKPLVVEGLGGTNAPLIAAAVAAAILALAYLAGWGGVFKPVIINGDVAPGADVPMGDRFVGLLRFAVSVAMWTGCGLGSLAFTAYLNGLRLGDVALAAARMLGIVAVMHLATLMSFSSSPVEWTFEAIAQAAIFAALSMVMFSLKPKDLPILVGGAIILFLTMWVSAWVVVWGTG